MPANTAEPRAHTNQSGSGPISTLQTTAILPCGRPALTEFRNFTYPMAKPVIPNLKNKIRQGRKAKAD
jgi:hypothetical protein